MSGRYDDIIDLPWPRKGTRDPMPVSERAAQFAPFAALTGFQAFLDRAEREAAGEGRPPAPGEEETAQQESE